MVECNEAIGLVDTLGGGVRNIALVPQGDVVEGDLGVGLHNARQPQTFSMVIGLRLCGMAELPF